ncbi:hypothetical protein AAVH_20112 [Aphelenchoides avenae]|nr:hypothetical protein AAVH_25150 [Aphelenchus avenae]KAH7712569.1 hypothetical protein AAVH_20112 [Aphelenchus avenae]
MKRQGSYQTTLDAYFGKRSRVAAAEDDQPDEVVVVSTGMTALQMIADAYADVEDVAEEVQPAVCANPADVAHDHDYCGTGVRTDTVANPEHVEHDHSYCSRPAQSGGAFGFDSSDDEPHDNDSDTPLEEEDEEAVEEIVPNDANDVDAEEELHLEDLYEVIDRRVKRVKKFGMNGYATKFVLKDDERVDQPVEMLRHVLQRFIDEALENSQEHGYSTDWMGLTFITERIIAKLKGVLNPGLAGDSRPLGPNRERWLNTPSFIAPFRTSDKTIIFRRNMAARWRHSIGN